jgi:uncharacterized FAD-dependent dehydrogenase
MKITEIIISHEEPYTSELVLNLIAKKLSVEVHKIKNFRILKRSLDARKEPRYILRCEVYFHSDELPPANQPCIPITDVSKRPEVVIIGAGPAGLFAALTLVTNNLKPVIIERGNAVRERRFDLASLMKRGELNPESNYCFGEGGAGTFSDGKLYTRSMKRGKISAILDTFIFFGADPDIAVAAHPHIGTNKLPKIITSIREHLIACGAEFHFSTKFESLVIKNNRVAGVHTNRGSFNSNAVLLATGHSARDVYHYLERTSLTLIPKGFAIGVRIEHPQEIINKIQYRKYWNSPNLPPASYQLVTQANKRGVYSFCMCPGGIICPAATDPERLVVNGWSPSRRNSPFANSGMVVEVPAESLDQTKGPLSGLWYQDAIESRAFKAGGGLYKAPAARTVDFIKNNGRISTELPKSSYAPGLEPADLNEVLPVELHSRLREGLKNFIQKNPLYGSSESIVVGVESRTSSPLRIPRNEKGMHPELTGLFPCGEGAGYAGGIVSAALDGINASHHISSFLKV